MENKNNKKISILYAIIFILLVLICEILLINIRYISTIILFVAILLSISIYFVFEKYYYNLSKKTRFLVILTTIFFLGILIEISHFFIVFPTIVVTENYDKALAIQNYIIKKYNTFAEINIFKTEHVLSLHTFSHRKFDKIAIGIADSDLFDDSVKIGIYYKYSDDSEIAKKRSETSFNKRVELIDGVIAAKTQIIDNENIVIDILIDKNADKDRIYKIVNNFFPIDNTKKTININKK